MVGKVCAAEPTTDVSADRARLDMARAKLPEGQFRAVPMNTLGNVG